MAAPPIYVEARIRAPLDEVWEKTQTPELHQRWDLRFSSIEYLPGVPGEPQRFRYSTRLGLGMRIDGTGESVGAREGANGARTSALTFRSSDRKSLILDGAGYWRYIPTEDGVRFLTQYHYEPRFGLLGRLVDRALFRPLLGWATAWSFDRLRLWLEEGVPPEQSRHRARARRCLRRPPAR